MVDALGTGNGWAASTTSARTRGIAVASIAHALVVAAWMLQPSAWRTAFEVQPIGVRLVDEARTLPDAVALPEPEVRRAPLPQVPIPEVTVARADPVPVIAAQPVAPQAIVAADAAPMVPQQVEPPVVAASAPVIASVIAPAAPRTVSPRSMDITQVRYQRAPAPAYPLASRRAHEEGRVEIRVLVDIVGAPQQLAVQRSSGFVRLDEAALAAVRATRFVPYAEDGTASAFWVVVPVIFELDT